MMLPFLDSLKTACLLEAILMTIARLVDLHRVYMRRYMIGHDLLSDVLVFLQSRHNFLVLSRFLPQC